MVFMKSIIIRHDYELSGFLLNKLDGVDVYPLGFFSDMAFFVNRKRNVFYYFVLYLLSFFCFFKIKPRTNAMIFFDIEDLLAIVRMTLFFNPKKRVIWLWNPLSRMSSSYRKKYLFITKMLGYKLWTFDPEDAIKYKINYHHQIYRSDLLPSSDFAEDIGVLFVGQDKKRITKLLEIKNHMSSLGVLTHFHVMAKPSKIYSNEEMSIIKESNVRYEEYLVLCSRSKCLLDIIQDEQHGLTLRCMESLFLEKKLITNNKNIKNYDFYNSSNIFILPDDGFTGIVDFMARDYIPVSADIKEKYKIKHLISNMIND